MATPNIVPRSDSEGGIGTASKYWGSAYIDTITTTSHINLPDNAKARFGTGTDLQIYHDGSDNYIKADGLGHLYIQQGLNDGDIIFSSDDGSGGITEYFRLDGGLTTLEFAKGAVFNTGSYVKLMDGITFFVGTGNDLRISHNGNDSFISQEGTGDLYIRNTTDDKDIIFQSDDGSGGLETFFFLDGSHGGGPITMFPDNSSINFGSTLGDLKIGHDGTNSTINNGTGALVLRQSVDDGNLLLQCDNGSGGTTTYITLDGGNTRTNVHKNLRFDDNIGAVFGSGAALKLHSDGSNGLIDGFQGALYIRNTVDDQDIIFQSDDGAGGQATYFYLDGSSATHDGSATTALFTNWPDFSRISLGTSHDMLMYHDGTQTVYQNRVGNLFITNSADDSDIIFQCDDGSGGVTEYFKLDGSANSGGFPVTVFPNNSLLWIGSSGAGMRFHADGSNSEFQNHQGNLTIVNNTDDGDIKFFCDDGSGGTTEYFRIDGGAKQTRISEEFNFLDSVKATFGAGGDMYLEHDSTNSVIVNTNGNLTISNQADDQDILFKCDDGSGGVTTYFRLDGGLAVTKFERDTKHNDNIRANFGAALDLAIYHNATDSIIQNNTGDLYIANGADDKDIIFQSDNGAGGLGTYFQLDGSVTKTLFSRQARFVDNIELEFGSSVDMTIHHDGTNSNITNKTGTLFINQDVNDGDIIFRSDDGTGGVAEYFKLDGSAEKVVSAKQFQANAGIELTGNLNAPDNSIIRLGSGADLQIYHDGSNSYIEDSGTGNLKIRTNSLNVLNAANSEVMIEATENAAVDLYYDAVKKLETTSGGAKIHGALTIEGTTDQILNLKVTDNGAVYHAYFRGSDRHAYVGFGGSGDVFSIVNEETDGDIVFSAYDGSGSTTPYLHLDASEVSTKILTQKVMMTNLPTSDPGNSGQLWNDNGTLKISVG